jgi:hypothetical protein
MGGSQEGENVQDIEKKRKRFLGGLMFWRR